MRLRNRFALVGFGVILFLLITPFLVLYARGFKIDWENRTLVKTGALVIRTEPSKADIFLNDKKLESNTPANVRFLLPGDYNIRVEKDGYQSWTKRLSVKSQLVTWANMNRDFLALFLKEPPQTEHWTINASTISRNGDEVIFIGEDRIGIVHVDDGRTSTLARVNNLNLPILNTEIQWQDSSQVVNLFANPSILNLLEDHMANIKHLETGGNDIVVQINSELYFIRSGKLVLIDKDVKNFVLDGSNVWYVQKNILKYFSISNNTYETVSAALPPATSARLIRTGNQLFLILDNSLFVQNNEVELLHSAVNAAYWDNTSSKLIFSNDHEIYLYDSHEKDASLIVRSLTPIKNPVLNSATGYLFYQNEGKIKAIELDARDHRNIFTIADAQDNFTLSKDGKILYTIGQKEIKEYQIR